MKRESSHVLRRLAALGVAILSLAAATSWADPPPRAARLSFVSGDVSLAPASLPDEWGEALVNRPLTGGDRLWVAQGSRAELRAGPTAVRLDGGTGLDLLDYDDARVQVSVDQGRVQVRTRGGPGGDAEIDTPAAAVVVADAAEVMVAVDPSSGRTDVAVRQGRASVYTPRETLAIVAGDVLTVDGGDATVSRIGAPDAFESFAIARDAQWREPRYVSRDMTGYEDLDAYGEWQAVASYGNVWYPRSVPAGWAPYRDGRWVWIEPWGWSWVDNAPWGFAPFHYGRWVYVDSRWGWAPGAVVARPVYAPALVAFYGGADFGVSVAIGGGAVGWFPLGWGDPYVPWYATTPAYRRSVNVAYVRDPVVLNQVVNVSVTNVTTIRDYRYAYRETTSAVTVVPRNAFVEAAPVRTAAVRIDPGRLRNASLVVGAAPAAPERISVVAGSPRVGGHGMREGRARPVVAVNAPPPVAGRFDEREAQARAAAGKPFEVKPIAPRAEPAARSNGARGGTSVASVDANREVRVLAPAPPGSVRQARDRPGAAGQEREAAPRQAAPAARATPPEAPMPREAQRESPASAARAAPPPAARDARRNEARTPQGEADARPHGPAPSAERGRSSPPAQASAPAPERRAASPRESQASAPPREARAAREPPANRAPQREAAPQPTPQREASAPQRPQEHKGKGEADRGRDERAQGERGHGHSG